jgi:hypothetical protein
VWDAKLWGPLIIFGIANVVTALVFGARLGTKVDDLLRRLAALDKMMEFLSQNMGRLDRTVSNIQGRLSGTVDHHKGDDNA